MATKAKYVDGFVIVVPKKNVAAYKKMAHEGARAWKRFGAIDYKECMGNDLKIKPQKGMPLPLGYPKLTKAKTNDTVWFSFIMFKNKTHRNEVNKKVMAFFDKKYANAKDMSMPFDVRKMSYGGFSVEVD